MAVVEFRLDWSTPGRLARSSGFVARGSLTLRTDTSLGSWSNVAARSVGTVHSPGFTSRARRAASGVVAIASILPASRTVGRTPAGSFLGELLGTWST